MSMGDSYHGRHRMDRSLDEIAAEMNSGLTQSSSSLPFGRDYEERNYIGAPIKGTSSRRSAPYSTSRRGSSYRRGGRGDSPERDDSRNNNRVFVANLSYETSWQMLKDHMRQAGPVKCDIFRDATGNSRGMGLAVYEDVEGAETALRTLTNTELDGRKLYLRKDMQHKEREKSGMSSYRGRGRPLPNPSCTVFVGNLDYEVTWQKLKDIFKVAGRVMNADILMDHQGKSKGLGEVQFEDPNDAISAIALFHGQMLFDRPMTVRMDSKSPFQPDPLQLKLSSLGGASGLGGLAGLSSNSDVGSFGGRGGAPQRNEREYMYEHKGGHGSSASYQPVRETHHESYPRRMGGFIAEATRHADFHDSRRSYNSSPPHPSYGRGGAESSRSYFPSSEGLDSEEYRGRGGSVRSHRPVIGDRNWRDRDSDRRFSAEGNRKLFVKNLNYSTSWQHLKDLFRGAGSVQHVDIMEGPDGQSKGCAVVWFDSPEVARRAIDMFNDCELEGRRLEVRYDRMN